MVWKVAVCHGHLSITSEQIKQNVVLLISILFVSNIKSESSLAIFL
jgi:hypothetical protein